MPPIKKRAFLLWVGLHKAYTAYAFTQFIPPSSIHKKYEICTVKDCGKATNGRQYCDKHISVDARRKLSDKQQIVIRSLCCGAKCV